MRKKFFSLIVLLCLLFGGCSNYKELNSVSIVVAMGIDYLPKEKQYSVVFQIINPSAIATQTSSQGLPVIALVEKGRTISEAARKLSKSNSRINIYSHVSLIVIGETLAKEESVDFLFDVFERDSKIRVNIPVILARKASVYDILKSLPPLDKIPAKSLTGKIKNTSSLLGENHETLIREVISAVSSKGREPTIDGVTLVQETPEAGTLANTETVKSAYGAINGLAVFKNGKLSGWLDGPPARAVQFVDNLIKETNIQIPCEKDKYDSMELTRVKTKTIIQIKKDIPHIHVKVNAIGHIDEVLCNDDFDKAKTLDKYAKSSEKIVKSMILDGLLQTQKIGGDIFGFGEKLHLANPKDFKKYEKDWNKIFQKANFKVTVDVQINDVGMRKKAYPY
ncbi:MULTISPECIES: Ger(x)C family spore germination protein [unclassified Bacillus (in: firmicutes)]|uniref:Ger(x)C family spore germination protein n=1 Tax=unclassified Bacillus (in: firmicutes) TaxID=185979 RepID=UPI000BF17AFA|nr:MULTISPECIES: Ger(x)C family spore germination protein [unclassified Bacillus (in: firmicutes)]PEJ56157.1 hypothetical protein CN692_18790 [Bacillus sp. AFS002410]PEL00015.1 hypothetical protein CN601_22490 [Bacillus sp. AFS017336]